MELKDTASFMSPYSLRHAPATVRVMDLLRHVPLPFLTSTFRVWEEGNVALVNDLRDRPEGDRWIALVTRDVSRPPSLDGGTLALLARVEAVVTHGAGGYELTVRGIARVRLAPVACPSGLPTTRVVPAQTSAPHDLDVRLDGLVQGVLSLTRAAQEARVELAGLLRALPHRLALLYRLAGLLIQDPGERLSFFSQLDFTVQIEQVTTAMASAIQLMDRRRDSGYTVGPEAPTS